MESVAVGLCSGIGNVGFADGNQHKLALAEVVRVRLAIDETMKRTILALAVLATIGALVVLALFAYIGFANDHAARLAHRLCRQVKAGALITDIQKTADELGMTTARDSSGRQYSFLAMGFGLDVAACNVEVSEGRATNAYADIKYAD